MSGPLAARLQSVRTALARLRAWSGPAFARLRAWCGPAYPLVGLAATALLAAAGRRWL